MNKKLLREIFYTIIGTILCAISTDAFLLPNKLSTGGLSGVGTILYYYYGISVGVTTIFLNIPLFIIAFFKLGKRFLIKTIIGTVSLALFLNLFENIIPFTHDRFLAAIYGGIIMGIGQSLIFEVQNSTGGSDLLVQIIKKFSKKISTSKLLVIIDIIIVTFNLIFLKDIEIGLYSAIAIYIVGKMIDLIFEGINFSKMIYVISNSSEEISKKIGEYVKKGSTGIYGKGMYLKEKKLILMCVVKRRDIIKVKEIINKIDKNAFLIITDAREVYGLGFKKQ